MNVTEKKCYMLDQGCPVHGYIHGKEAEELREGIEDLLEQHTQHAGGDESTAWKLLRGLRKLLDETDARDSLAWLESSDRPKAGTRKAHVEGVCMPVCGEEESYLQFFSKEHRAESITSILSKAGAPPTGWRLANALELPNEEYFSTIVEQYRTESGRTYPPLYRVRIHVVVEDVDAEETAKLWKEEDRSAQGDDA